MRREERERRIGGRSVCAPAPEILGGLRLASTGGAGGRAAKAQAERLRERDVAAIGKPGDHEAARVADVLVLVGELGVRDVDEAVALLLVPSELELRLPRKVARRLDALGDVLEHDVARVHLDRDERLHLGAHLTRHLTEHQVDVDAQVGDLRGGVVLHRCVVALLEPLEGLVDLGRPPDLARGDAQLRTVLVEPLVARHLNILVESELELVAEVVDAIVHQL